MSKTFTKIILIFSVFVFNYNESQITDAAVNLFIQLYWDIYNALFHTNIHIRVFLCCSPTNYRPIITATSYGSYE